VLSPDQQRWLLGILAGPLLRAQESRQVRGDLVVEDVPLLLRMLGATARPGPAGPAGADWERYLRLLLEGLRASD
jgi:hypothetical protein